MPVFQYKALAPSGEVLQGRMEASSADEVAMRLQDAGNIPVEAVEADAAQTAGLFAGLFRKGGMNARQIRDFTQQMATLLGAGLPLDRALMILVDLAEDDKTRRLVERVRDQVRGGTSLSESLDSQHGVFSKLYINMVRAGELGGALDETLKRLSEYLKRSAELKDGVVSALIYPAILAVLSVAALIILLVFVIPQFTPIFEQLGGELPMLTRIVLAVGTTIQYYWWAIAIVVFTIVAWFRRQMAQPETRYKWDSRFLKARIVGDLISKIEMARLARTVGTLLRNGVPLLGALSISRNIANNTVLGEGIEIATKEVKEGAGLANTLAATKRFPKLALQMISVGEETGQLDEMLLRVADTYDHEVKTTVDRALAAFVPVMILVMTGLISMIVMSVLLAILSVNDLVQ